MEVPPVPNVAVAALPTTVASMAPVASVAARVTLRGVFDEHYEFVWRTLRRLGIPEADVDDAVQEVFMVVHRKLADFEGRSKLTTWLFGICYRIASEHRRRPVRAIDPSADALDDAADPGASPEDRYQGREARAKLDEVLAQLDADKRAVFVLYEIDEMPVDQIAEMVGIPVGTVYSRLKAARAEFEKALARLRARWARLAMGRE